MLFITVHTSFTLSPTPTIPSWLSLQHLEQLFITFLANVIGLELFSMTRRARRTNRCFISIFPAPLAPVPASPAFAPRICAGCPSRCPSRTIRRCWCCNILEHRVRRHRRRLRRLRRWRREWVAAPAAVRRSHVRGAARLHDRPSARYARCDLVRALSEVEFQIPRMQTRAFFRKKPRQAVWSSGMIPVLGGTTHFFLHGVATRQHYTPRRCRMRVPHSRRRRSRPHCNFILHFWFIFTSSLWC